MEDLVWLFFIFCLVAIVMAAVMAGFVVAATIATICVFGAATHAFLVTLGRGVVHRGGAAAVSGPNEPSFRAYYRGQVWRDLWLATRAAWTAATRETGRIRALVPPNWDAMVRVVVVVALAAYAYVGLGIGAVLAAVVGLVPAALIALLALVTWLVGAPLRAFERLRRKRKGAYYDCQECHDRFPLPNYLCPSCGARHGELAPGRFGVLRHRCTCGARLPAVQFRGRERLAAECPQGHALGEGVGIVRTFHVPVAGGPSTGKSTFLAAALVELDEAASAGKLATTVQHTSRQAYDRAIEAFRKGVPPPKTSGLPPAMVAEVRGDSKSALLYAYDVAGEVYGAEDELRRDPAHGLAQGVVLLVDPFALDRVRVDHGDEIAQVPELRPSEEAPQRMLERLIGVLEEQGADLTKVSAAVCVTKIDALGIGDAIAAAPGATDHERTRAWLEQQGAGNFLRAAEGAFKEVACFGVSALGRVPGTGDGAFVPEGAAAPLLWLLSRAGIEAAAVGAAQRTESERQTATTALEVMPKRPLYRTPLDAVPALGPVRYFGIGLAAALVLGLAVLPFAGSSGPDPTSPPLVYASSSSDGDGAGVSSTGTSGGDDGGYDDGDYDDGASGGSGGSGSSSGSTPAGPTPGSPGGVITRHYKRLGSGSYDAAFRLMTAAYRSANPGWVSERSAAEPFINVAEVGRARYQGGGVATVHVKFYGRDTFDTPNSDTACRRFEGDVRMVKQGGVWRYAPPGDFTIAELPSDLGVCNP